MKNAPIALRITDICNTMHISGKILIAIGIMIGIGGGILLAVGIGDLSDNEKFQYEEVTSVVAQIEDSDNVRRLWFWHLRRRSTWRC